MASVKLEIYGQSVKIIPFDPYAKSCALEFCRSMIKYKTERIVDTSRPGFHAQLVKVPDCTFAAAPVSREFFCVHRGQLEEFKNYLARCGITPSEIETVIVPEYVPTKANLVMKSFWVDKPHQTPIIQFILEDGKLKILPVQTGGGKCVPLTTKLRIPGGWTTMGEAYVGMPIVGGNGKPTTVTAVYPQQPKQIYKITLRDGRVVRASGEHLWKSFYINTTEAKRWGVRNTLEIKRLISMPNPRVYLPLNQPEMTPDIDLPIDPYLLGVLLGDGCISQNSVGYCKPDTELAESLAAHLPSGMKLVPCADDKTWFMVMDKTSPSYTPGQNVLKEKLIALGLMGKVHHQKFIPEQYFEAGYRQRVQLIQGLMDTDGTVDNKSTTSFSSSSKELSEGLQRLIWSIGGMAKLTPRKTQYTYKGEVHEGLTDYRLHIRMPKPSLLFRLSRKKDLTNDYHQYATGLKLQVMSIEEDGFEPTQCISVANEEKLYLIDNYVVTHNTYMGLKAASIIGERMMLITRGGYIDKWIEDVKKTYDIDDDRILVVKGEKALMRAIEKAKEGDFDYDVLLVSTGGMSDYIKHYEQYHGTPMGEHYMDPRAIGMLFGVGLRIVDEAHQMLHAYYRIDLYSHFNKVLFLSATILANDALEQRVHEIIYPQNCRYLGSEWKCYITATSLRYNLAEPHKARFKDHRKNYSHVIYEQYLMRNKEKLKHYLNMVANLTNDFLKHRLDGQKYLIFASTVDMCDVMVADLKKRFPNVIVGRYVAEDKLEDIYGYDVIVTTPGSGGTGIDIPDLAKALATCAVSSSKLNVQMLGRLRELKNYPGEEPEYQYLVCYDIPKQVEYHKQKLELFKGKVKNHREQNTGVLV